MAHTHLDPLRKPLTDVDLTVVVNTIYTWAESSQADSDKADSTDDVCFYDGNVNMAISVLGLLTENDKNESVANTARADKLARTYQCQFSARSKHWRELSDYNLLFLGAVERWCNETLNKQGHLMVNDVLKELGLRQTGYGAINGWLLKNGSKVDFGINLDQVLSDIDRGPLEFIQLTMVHDGVMYREIGDAP